MLAWILNLNFSGSPGLEILLILVLEDVLLRSTLVSDALQRSTFIDDAVGRSSLGSDSLIT